MEEDLVHDEICGNCINFTGEECDITDSEAYHEDESCENYKEE